MQPTLVPGTLSGKWLVRCQAGFLPRAGLSKLIHGDGRGVTRVLGVPLLPFRVRIRPDGTSAELRYRFLPLRDELYLRPQGWAGRGLLFGREFCKFRLVRAPRPTLPHQSPVPHF